MTSYFTRSDLIAEGFTPRGLTAAVREKTLIRARRDRYFLPDADDEFVRAVRVGGRLTCLSLLARHGVFVVENSKLHVHVATNAARLRSPHDRRRKLEPRTSRGVHLHWTGLTRAPGNSSSVDVVDALIHAVCCQPPRAAVATLDSAIHEGLVTAADVEVVFAALPPRFDVLRRLVDGRSESGTESLVRLMLRALGFRVELQKDFEGVGRVDFLVDGWLVIECDSQKHHGTWQDHERDRRRDALLAARGYTTLRFTARDILHHPELVMEALRGLRAARP